MLIKYNDDRQAEENYISIGYIDENKVEAIDFEFPEYLQKFSKKIIIRNNEKNISLVKLFDDVVTNKFTFTKDVTKFDKILFSVDFFEEDKEDTILYKTKPLLIFFRESLSCDDEISEDEPKLKILNDLIIKVGKCITETEKAAENANTQAEYAKEQADNVKIANEEAKKIIDKFEANVGDHIKSAKSEIDKEAKTQTDNFNSNAEKTIKEYNDNSSTKIKEYNDNAAEKMNEYTNTAKTKMDEFNQNAENKLQEYNDNAEILKEKVDLLESNLEDVKVSGENIEIDDALEYYTDKHKIYGKSVQETRELSQNTASGEEVSLINVETSKDIDIFADGNYKQGENPSPENEQPIEVIDGCNRFDVQEFQNQFVAGKILNDDGNEISDSTSQYSKYKIFLKANKSYYIKGAFQRLYYYDSAGNFKKRSQSVDGIDRAYMPVKDEYISFQINNNFWNTNKGSEQLTEGTEEKPYLPHGSIGLKFSGKNFLKLQDGTYTNNGITCVVSDGVITANGTASINTVCNIPINEITLNGTYISSSFNTIANANVHSRLDGDSETYYNLENVNATHTFTKNGNIKYTKYVFRVTGGTTLNNFIVKPMLSVDVGDYEPYHEPQLIAVDLAGNSIAKINDSIKDKLSIYRNGKVILGKKTNRYIFNGNENWQSQTGNHIKVQNLYISIDNMKGTNSGGSCCCNIAKFSMLAGQQNDTTINICKPNAMGYNLLVDVSQELFPTINSFKQYLLQQYENGTPVYADYELATPQTIELPSVDMPELWEGTANIELISNLETNLNVNYNIVPAMPSLEARSDIESTGEKYNIFNKDARIITSGTTKENLDTGVRVIGTIDGQYRYCSIELGKKELLGKNITMQAKIQSSNQNIGIASFNFGNENSPAIKSINSFNKEYEKKVVSIPAEFPKNCDRIYLILYANLNGTLKKGDYVDYKDLMASIGSNEKPYVPYDIGAINIKQQNENLLNTFDYTYVSNDENENITFKNGQFIFNGNWKKWVAQLFTYSLTNYWAEANYGDYVDLSKKSVNILKAGKYYLKIKYISGNISTNGGLKFNYRLDTNTTGKSFSIGEFKSNVKKGDIIKKTIEIVEDTPFTLTTTMFRAEDTAYDNFTFTAILEKDEETEKIVEHKEELYQMLLSKNLRGIKIKNKEYNKSLANYQDKNGDLWCCDYIDDNGIYRKIKRKIFDGTENFKYDKGTDENNVKNYSLVLEFTDGASNNTDVMCNYFQNLSVYGLKDVTGIYLTKYYFYFSFPKAFASTQEEWKQKIKELYEAGTPLYADYISVEEKLEEFTEEERKSWNEFKKLKTFKGKNYINSTDEIQAGIEFTYKKDSRISTQKELEKCNERLANIEQLLSTTETSSLLLDNLEKDLEEEV